MALLSVFPVLLLILNMQYIKNAGHFKMIAYVGLMDSINVNDKMSLWATVHLKKPPTVCTCYVFIAMLDFSGLIIRLKYIFM